MAKIPKKIDQEIKPLDLRQFVSSAAQKPASASAVTRINLTMTDDGLVSAEERRRLFDDIRKNSPKAGRPTVNK